MQMTDLNCFDLPSPIKTLYKYNDMWFDGLTDELLSLLDKEKEQKSLKEKNLKSIIKNLLDDGTIEDIYNLIETEKNQIEMSHLQKYDYFGRFLNSDETFMITDLKYDGHDFLDTEVSVVSYSDYAYLRPELEVPVFGRLPNTVHINDEFCWEAVRILPRKKEVYKAFENFGVTFENKESNRIKKKTLSCWKIHNRFDD